jgi:hypothetical protein
MGWKMSRRYTSKRRSIREEFLDPGYVSEIVAEYLVNAFKPDLDTIADMYDLEYEDDAFYYYKTRGKIYPGIDAQDILEEKLHADLEDFFEDYATSEIIYDLIHDGVEILDNKIGIQTVTGREWEIGIPVKEIDLEAEDIVPNIDKVADDFAKIFIKEEYTGRDEEMDDEEWDDYLVDWILEFTERHIEKFYDYVSIPVLNKFIEEVENLIKGYFSPENWADMLEAYAKEYIKSKGKRRR